MDRRDAMALSILTTLIMEPAPPEGYDWVLNQLTDHLPVGTPHRILLAKASVLLADTLLECLAEPAEFPEADAPEPEPEPEPDDISLSGAQLEGLPGLEVGAVTLTE